MDLNGGQRPVQSFEAQQVNRNIFQLLNVARFCDRRGQGVPDEGGASSPCAVAVRSTNAAQLQGDFGTALLARSCLCSTRVEASFAKKLPRQCKRLLY